MISLRAVAVAAFALSTYPTITPPAASAEATVMSLIVRPDSQRVDVVVGIRGDVSVRDFVLRGPDRIALDISNATLGLARNQSYDHASRGGIVNVHYAQNTPNVVRVVVTLDSPRPYRLTQDADGVRISVMGASSTLPAWVIGYQAAKMASVRPTPVIPPAPRRQAGQAPARAVGNTTMAAPATILVNGRAVPVPQQQSQERRITINFENQDILEVLKIFSEYSGRSIVPSNKVRGTISASIADVPWDVALKALLNLNGFDAFENEFGMITVDTFESLNTKAASQPLTTQSLSFNYTSAAAVAEILKSRLSRECPTSVVQTPSATFGAPTTVTDPTTGVAVPQVAQPQAQPVITTGNCPVRGAVVFDTLTNSVHITDVASNVESLVQYARTLDRRQPQVNIKAKIILVDRTELEGLGLRYDLGSQAQFFGDLIPRTDSSGAELPGGQIALGGNAIAAIANAGARVPGAALQLAYSTALGAFDFTTFFEALQSTSLLDVQAEPNGTVLNNQTLMLTAGTDVPIRTQEAGAGANAAGDVAQVTVQTRTTGVILQVTPRVTNDGRVQMKVHIENSSVTFSGADAIAFPKQSVDNVIMIADGATWVIGGLTQTSVTSTRTGIPLLMELPVIGRLFGVTNRQETKRDLLILITPHIVDPGQDAGTGR
jgi:type IV pilus assembly protein PilQ